MLFLSKRKATQFQEMCESLCFTFKASFKPYFIKGNVSLDWAIWALKNVCYEMNWNVYGWKDVFKVEYNDPRANVP